MKTETRVDLMWFASQGALCLAMIIAAVLKRRRVPSSARVLGLGVILAGGMMAAAGYRTLGQSHSAWSTPAPGAHLVTTGIYRHIRHPIYLGWSLAAFGAALLTGSVPGLAVGAALIGFYDVRARHEERQLVERYPGYAQYASSSSRFIPAFY